MAEPLTDEEIQAACREALTNSLGAPDSDVSRARERNLDFYNAEPVGELAPPEIEEVCGSEGRACWPGLSESEGIVTRGKGRVTPRRTPGRLRGRG